MNKLERRVKQVENNMQSLLNIMKDLHKIVDKNIDEIQKLNFIIKKDQK